MSGANLVDQCSCRPHLHSFFATAYQDFDIVIWSANSLKWMNVKMSALGVLDHADYKIAFMIDYRSMLTVHTQRRGVRCWYITVCVGC